MWQVYQPARSIFGEGEIKNIGKYMAEAGMDKTLLISTPSMVRSGIAEQVKEASDGRIIEISDHVLPDAHVSNVNENIDIALRIGARSIVALGGGSAIDCAKVTAAALGEGVRAEKFLGNQFRPEKVLPILAIPTTSGSGSELTGDAGLHGDCPGEMGGIIMNPHIIPRVAIVDPELTYSVPASVTANTGFDALCHAIDALGSIHANPYTDAQAECAVRLVIENLEAAVKDGSDKKARAGLSAASHIAAFAFSQAGITGTHATGFAICGRYHIPHGAGCAFAPEYWLKANSRVRPELEDSARRIGFDNVDGLCERIVQLRENVGIAGTLTELGYQPGDESMLAKMTLHMFPMALNVAKPTEEELLEMYSSRIYTA